MDLIHVLVLMQLLDIKQLNQNLNNLQLIVQYVIIHDLVINVMLMGLVSLINEKLALYGIHYLVKGHIFVLGDV